MLFPLSLCFLPEFFICSSISCHVDIIPMWYGDNVLYSAIHLLRSRRLRYFSNIYSLVALSLEPHRWESLSIYHPKYKLPLLHDSHSILSFIEPWYNVWEIRTDTPPPPSPRPWEAENILSGITNQLNILYNVHSKHSVISERSKCL